LKKSVYHKRIVCFLFPVALFFIVAGAYSQQPSIKTSVDKTGILIGEQLEYKVAVSMPDNTYRLTWFTLPDSLGNFRLVTFNKIDSAFSNGNLYFSQDVTLTSFDSGRQVIPSLALNFETQQGDSAFTIVTDSIPVMVSFSPMDSVATFHDIKSIIEVKKQWPWWLWALLGVALILLAIWIRFLIKFFRKKKEDQGIFTSKLSPYDEAMKLLSELSEEQLPANSKEKQFHIRLNEIFKRFLSRRTKTFKMQLTSDEILMDLDDYGLNKESLSAFANCLRMSNAVKFAKYIPPENESEKCLDQTRELIKEIQNNLNKKPESAI
jgi:hypothetical protein